MQLNVNDSEIANADPFASKSNVSASSKLNTTTSSVNQQQNVNANFANNQPRVDGNKGKFEIFMC